VEFEALEDLSRLFQYDVLAVSEESDIDLGQLLGRPAHIEVDADEIAQRFYHGLVIEAAWERTEESLNFYRLTLRPWFYLLGKTTDCRIHHDKTAIAIIRETLLRRGFHDFRFATVESYPTLHYTVQYRETDLDFVCRLAEQHGIYYFFEHSADRHELIFADSASAHKPAAGQATVPFNPDSVGGLNAPAAMYSWRWRRELRSGKVTLSDYNHLKPTADLNGDRSANEAYAHGKLEVFDHPGPHAAKKDGEFYARVRLEAEQTSDKRRMARGVAVALYPGARVELERHPHASENDEWLVVSVHGRFGPQHYRSRGRDARGVGNFDAEYELHRLSVPFRAPLATPKPLIHSLQTAMVVGAKGEEIDCDDHGRILVHFFWDRHGDCSCRLRVCQVWAAQKWGAQVIPRVGMEVIVAYLDGDPDRPIVVGCVPNPEKKQTPEELPAKKTRMVWRSQTYKGSGFNELAFEDATDAELFFMRAQKDMQTLVLHNQETQVEGPLRSITVTTGDEKKEISQGNLSERISQTRRTDSNATEFVAEDHIVLTVGSNTISIDQQKIVITVGGASQITLTKQVIEQISSLIKLN
jgi:type VI secretion system secreted protein VgrG